MTGDTVKAEHTVVGLRASADINQSLGCLRISSYSLTRKLPQTRISPLSDKATLTLSPAATLTALNPSFSSVSTTKGYVSRSSFGMVALGSFGSGTLAVIRPSAALSLIPHDRTCA